MGAEDVGPSGLTAEEEARALAVYRASLKLDFSDVGPDCPWFKESRIHGLAWSSLVGETGHAPDAGSLSVRLEVEAHRGGWLQVEPRDKWTVDQVNKPRLLALFGGGRLWKASIRYKGNTLPGSTLQIDLRNDPDERRPIPGDEPPPAAQHHAATQAAPAVLTSGDPLTMYLSALPPDARGPVGLLLHFSQRDEARNENYFKGLLEASRHASQVQAAGLAGAPDLIRRLESELDTARRERDEARRHEAALRDENAGLRLKLGLIEGGAPSNAAASPLWSFAQHAAGQFMAGAAPAVAGRITDAALAALPPEQRAALMQQALGAAGGLGPGQGGGST